MFRQASKLSSGKESFQQLGTSLIMSPQSPSLMPKYSPGIFILATEEQVKIKEESVEPGLAAKPVKQPMPDPGAAPNHETDEPRALDPADPAELVTIQLSPYYSQLYLHQQELELDDQRRRKALHNL